MLPGVLALLAPELEPNRRPAIELITFDLTFFAAERFGEAALLLPELPLAVASCEPRFDFAGGTLDSLLPPLPPFRPCRSVEPALFGLFLPDPRTEEFFLDNCDNLLPRLPFSLEP